MALEADRELAALVAREQRGFRFILITGLILLVLLLALSIAFALSVTQAANQLSATQAEMQREAFKARRDMDAQSNSVSDQGRRLRRLSQDMRRPEFQAEVAVTPESAFASVRAFLRQGRLTIEDERQIERAEETGIGSPALQALVSGAYRLMDWERLGDSVAADATELPRRLQRALTFFDEASQLDPALASTAAAGQAWVHYIRVSSPLSNYAPADCDALSATVAASAENGELGPQPLWWQAQCERKRGRPGDALRDYALALEDSYESALQRGGGGMRNRSAELTVAMNAFHGVGTTLIALHTTPATDENKARAIAIAERACTEETAGNNFELAATSPDLRLAEACLRAAMALRRRLGQTANQISGSGENLTFVYLAEENYPRAYEHAMEVERTGLFAWNELMRALAAERVEASDDVRRVRTQARRHVALFRVNQFNLCELRVLLGEALYAEAERIVREEHRGEEVGCTGVS